MAGQSMKVFESAYLQWRSGALNDDLWLGLSSASTDVANQNGMRHWWAHRKSWYGDSFRQWVDEYLESSQPKLMYAFRQEAVESP